MASDPASPASAASRLDDYVDEYGWVFEMANGISFAKVAHLGADALVQRCAAHRLRAVLIAWRWQQIMALNERRHRTRLAQLVLAMEMEAAVSYRRVRPPPPPYPPSMEVDELRNCIEVYLGEWPRQL